MSVPRAQVGKGEAYLKITFVNVCWGLSFIASKYAMQQGFGEFTLAFVRYLFVCAIMLPVLRVRKGRLVLPSRGDLPAILLSGLTGIALYFAFEYLGVRLTSAANASLVISTVPALSIIWSALRGHRYAKACWLGVLLSTTGVFFVAYAGAARESGGVDAQVILGNLLLLGACVSWVVYAEICNKLLKRNEHLPLTVWQGVAGLAALTPMALYEGAAGKWIQVPLGGWIAAFFLAIICSALCYFFYAQAISALSPVQTSIFINLNPIVAVVAGAVLLGERIQLLQMMGGVCIICSVFLVNYGMNVRE